jgi:hypothetical protein
MITFPLLGIVPSIHLAIGTSLATIIITLLSSANTHLRRGNQALIKSLIKRLIPGIMIGTLLGSLLAKCLSSGYLTLVFGIVTWLLALRILFIRSSSQTTDVEWHLPKTFVLTCVNILIGGIAALMGIGGGGFMVPFLQHCQVPIRIAIPVASITGIPVSIIGTISYVLLGIHDSAMPPFSTGYIYWPAFIGITLTSIFAAPVGAKLAHKLSPTLLRWIFAFVLLVIGTKMIFFA